MADPFRLKIVTPEKTVYDEDINMIVFNTTEGYMGVLKGHIPLTTVLVSGVATITKNEEIIKLAVHAGFAEVTGDTTTLLCDSAELPEEIDLERATKAKERAEERLKVTDMNALRAKSALMRALSRIELSSKK